jgi:flagellar biosynthesis chaperone FliJ
MSSPPKDDIEDGYLSPTTDDGSEIYKEVETIEEKVRDIMEKTYIMDDWSRDTMLEYVRVLKRHRRALKDGKANTDVPYEQLDTIVNKRVDTINAETSLTIKQLYASLQLKEQKMEMLAKENQLLKESLQKDPKKFMSTSPVIKKELDAINEERKKLQQKIQNGKDVDFRRVNKDTVGEMLLRLRKEHPEFVSYSTLAIEYHIYKIDLSKRKPYTINGGFTFVDYLLAWSIIDALGYPLEMKPFVNYMIGDISEAVENLYETIPVTSFFEFKSKGIQELLAKLEESAKDKMDKYVVAEQLLNGWDAIVDLNPLDDNKRDTWSNKLGEFNDRILSDDITFDLGGGGGGGVSSSVLKEKEAEIQRLRSELSDATRYIQQLELQMESLRKLLENTSAADEAKKIQEEAEKEKQRLQEEKETKWDDDFDEAIGQVNQLDDKMIDALKAATVASNKGDKPALEKEVRNSSDLFEEAKLWYGQADRVTKESGQGSKATAVGHIQGTLNSINQKRIQIQQLLTDLNSAPKPAPPVLTGHTAAPASPPAKKAAPAPVPAPVPAPTKQAPPAAPSKGPSKFPYQSSIRRTNNKFGRVSPLDLGNLQDVNRFSGDQYIPMGSNGLTALLYELIALQPVDTSNNIKITKSIQEGNVFGMMTKMVCPNGKLFGEVLADAGINPLNADGKLVGQQIYNTTGDNSLLNEQLMPYFAPDGFIHQLRSALSLDDLIRDSPEIEDFIKNIKQIVDDLADQKLINDFSRLLDKQDNGRFCPLPINHSKTLQFVSWFRLQKDTPEWEGQWADQLVENLSTLFKHKDNKYQYVVRLITSLLFEFYSDEITDSIDLLGAKDAFLKEGHVFALDATKDKMIDKTQYGLLLMYYFHKFYAYPLMWALHRNVLKHKGNLELVPEKTKDGLKEWTQYIIKRLLNPDWHIQDTASNTVLELHQLFFTPTFSFNVWDKLDDKLIENQAKGSSFLPFLVASTVHGAFNFRNEYGSFDRVLGLHPINTVLEQFISETKGDPTMVDRFNKANQDLLVQPASPSSMMKANGSIADGYEGCIESAILSPLSFCFKMLTSLAKGDTAALSEALVDIQREAKNIVAVDQLFGTTGTLAGKSPSIFEQNILRSIAVFFGVHPDDFTYDTPAFKVKAVKTKNVNVIRFVMPALLEGDRSLVDKDDVKSAYGNLYVSRGSSNATPPTRKVGGIGAKRIATSPKPTSARALVAVAESSSSSEEKKTLDSTLILLSTTKDLKAFSDCVEKLAQLFGSSNNSTVKKEFIGKTTLPEFQRQQKSIEASSETYKKFVADTKGFISWSKFVSGATDYITYGV